MREEIDGNMACGFYCPICNHCDAEVLEYNPAPGVRFELMCLKCEHEWWVEE